MATPRIATPRRRVSPAYSRVEQLIAREQCVVLDGGIATELEGLETPGYKLTDDSMWGSWALLNAPEAVMRVHRAYVDVGCDIISTDTWGIQSDLTALGGPSGEPAADWMELARRGIRLARKAAAEQGRASDCAVAFSLHGDVADGKGLERLELLTRVFEDEPPDLVLLETMSLIRDRTLEGVQTLIDSGFPVWLSFRRCRHGLCGVFGQHWGGPEGDLFGRAARRFEEMGIGALLINCIPPDHVDGMLPWLRDFTDLPLGVYPNLGYYTESGWSFDKSVGGGEYADLAAEWREEGAQIIGGCCGVRPHHLSAARAKLSGTRPGRKRASSFEPYRRDPAGRAAEPDAVHAELWRDEHDRPLYPLPVPEMVLEPGVFVPTQGSFLLWKHLFSDGIGRDKNCLDVGCGTGLLTAQLALNGASHVHAIDIDRAAVANTLSNAFRNDVADRVSGEQVDLYPWVPEERYDIVVASLYQMPNDPFEQLTSHRPLDYWGRSLFDHMLGLLPKLLNDDGRAYVMQLSILSQSETVRQLAQRGLHSRVLDFAFFEFSNVFEEYETQIKRVEELSDAYHLRFGDVDTMVAYLLEISPRRMTGGHYLAEQPVSAAYERIDGLLSGGGRVLLDGGVATELQQVRAEERAQRREPWGTWALFQGPVDVLEVHRRFVASGADVISTNTWSVLEAADETAVSQPVLRRNPLWAEAARLGVRLARQAIDEAGDRADRAAAFCINSALLDEHAQGRLELLSWVWHEEPPDLVILETLEAVPDEVALETISMVTATGLPVWVSFRRRAGGMSSVDGRVLPDTNADAFPAALRSLESLGVRAVLVNCVPAGELDDTLRALREHTSLPIGCYPNLGHSAGARWEFDSGVGPHEYAEMAKSWKGAGAQIVGGCCGVTAKHIAALR